MSIIVVVFYTNSTCSYPPDIHIVHVGGQRHSILLWEQFIAHFLHRNVKPAVKHTEATTSREHDYTQLCVS